MKDFNIYNVTYNENWNVYMSYIAIDNANDKMCIMRMSYTHTKFSYLFIFIHVNIIWGDGGKRESINL